MDFTPKNEQGVVVYFSVHSPSYGWRLLEIGTAFPDASYLYKDEIWKVEFEYKASNFIAHGHDIEGADLVVCWENDLESFPIPILELSNDSWKDKNWVKGLDIRELANYWRTRALRAEYRLRKEEEEDLPAKFVPYDDEKLCREMLEIYAEDPSFSDHRMGERIGVSKAKAQSLLVDLVNKGTVSIERNGKFKIVTILDSI